MAGWDGRLPRPIERGEVEVVDDSPVAIGKMDRFEEVFFDREDIDAEAREDRVHRLIGVRVVEVKRAARELPRGLGMPPHEQQLAVAGNDRAQLNAVCSHVVFTASVWSTLSRRTLSGAGSSVSGRSSAFSQAPASGTISLSHSQTV